MGVWTGQEELWGGLLRYVITVILRSLGEQGLGWGHLFGRSHEAIKQ